MEEVTRLRNSFTRRHYELPDQYSIRVSKAILRIACFAFICLACTATIVYLNPDLFAYSTEIPLPYLAIRAVTFVRDFTFIILAGSVCMVYIDGLNW